MSCFFNERLPTKWEAVDRHPLRAGCKLSRCVCPRSRWARLSMPASERSPAVRRSHFERAARRRRAVANARRDISTPSLLSPAERRPPSARFQRLCSCGNLQRPWRSIRRSEKPDDLRTGQEPAAPRAGGQGSVVHASQAPASLARNLPASRAADRAALPAAGVQRRLPRAHGHSFDLAAKPRPEPGKRGAGGGDAAARRG